MSLHQTPWHQGCSIYEIYIRSFFDSNNDGIGDLPGIKQKLEYLADLNVDVIWISPFYESPMKDFGYDVSNYCSVDPIFGTIEDFRQLVVKAHELDLKVIIDQVWSHTSNKHSWYLASSDPLHPEHEKYKDWYVWADANPHDGGVPNNWLSVFGGVAWEWHPRRQQYYLHNFLREQIDLNWHNPEVRQEIAKIARFWLDLGVDGFRLDVCNFFTHDVELRNNPDRPPNSPRLLGIDEKTPFAVQSHVHNINQKQNLEYLREIKRNTVDHYNDRALLGEIVAVDCPMTTMHEYIDADTQLAMAYTGALIHDDIFKAYVIGDLLQRCEEKIPHQMLCWLTGTHDFPRIATRCEVTGKTDQQRYLRLALLLLIAIRGNICIYQGEELGLEEARIAYHQMQDPYGIALHPEAKTRDGCRTPMPWQKDVPNMGFSTAEKTWLPLWQNHQPYCIDVQEAIPHSLLQFYRQALKVRRENPVLRMGTLENITIDGPILYFTRSFEDKKMWCVFNFSEERQQLPSERRFFGPPILDNYTLDSNDIPPFYAGIFQ
ncbi:glycosidase [Xenococcus sp. PCC 7305]|uniref:alpha-amylase family glycosyl hydrolase n=1 Tax=Xenococcus sp. PCC 7305 TaxID=102125 RepID=UPI0002AC33CA|nr:alpha-amylase family glycosyl hydrolase [Xenococcus sp. PCC 7305]ELS03200.1 glycosidase [Xenococcus sp. PCC 7305]